MTVSRGFRRAAYFRAEVILIARHRSFTPLPRFAIRRQWFTRNRLQWFIRNRSIMRRNIVRRRLFIPRRSVRRR